MNQKTIQELNKSLKEKPKETREVFEKAIEFDKRGEKNIDIFF